MARRGRRRRGSEIRVGRRLVLAGALVACGVGGVAAAVDLEDPGPAPRPGEVTATPGTPVLSARRLPAALAAPTADRLLAEALAPILARQEAETMCLTVAAGSRVVFSHDPDAVVVPASVLKLLTAAAALEVLGPDHVFTTRIVAAAPPGPDGVVDGDVWVVGGGDPLLATGAYVARFRDQPQVHTSVETLVATLAARGITAITGRVLGDESRYDDDRYPDPWPARFVPQDQSGPLSALTVNDGWVEFPATFEEATPDETPAEDPAAHAAGIVADLASGHGIDVGGSGAGVAPEGAVELASISSPPLRDIVGELLRQSDNQTGELLLKELALALGRPPTTAEGAAVVSNVAVDLELPFTVVVDGSGLAGGNRVSCATVQGLLDALGPDSPLGQGLPAAGREGTLFARFRDTPVEGRLRAKTGTLNAVTALAGYLDTANGARASFAYIVNLAPPDAVDGTTTNLVDRDDLALQEELVAAIDTYPSGPPLAELGPLPVVAPAAPGG